MLRRLLTHTLLILDELPYFNTRKNRTIYYQLLASSLLRRGHVYWSSSFQRGRIS